MAVKRFRRFETTYNCGVCGRLTRNTGDEGGAELCKHCWELAGYDNQISDYGMDDFNKDGGEAGVLRFLTELKALGVDITEHWGTTNLKPFVLRVLDQAEPVKPVAKKPRAKKAKVEPVAPVVTKAMCVPRKLRGVVLANAMKREHVCEHGHTACSDAYYGACSVELRQIIDTEHAQEAK